MKRHQTTKIITTAAMLLVFGTLVLTSGGCYRKVVDSRGIGSDSAKLRRSHESQPLDFITTENRVDNRKVRSAREREKR